MATCDAIDFPISTAMNELVVKVRVTGIKVFRVRFWIGKNLFLLAAWIMGCGIEVEFNGD